MPDHLGKDGRGCHTTLPHDFTSCRFMAAGGEESRDKEVYVYVAGNNLIELTDANFEDEVLKSQIPVLVDFWAEWCAPCRMVTPVIEEIAGQYAGRVKVAKLNVDANRETAAKYDIMSIPTVILFENGEVSKQVVGAMPRESLEKELGLGLSD